MSDWKTVKVEDACETVSVGIVVKPSQYYTTPELGVRAFRSLNVGEGKINDKSWIYISKEGHEKNSKSALKSGDVLVVRSGAPGTSCVVTKEYEDSNCIDIVFARPKPNILCPHYLSTFTNSDFGKRHIASTEGGLALKHFNVGAFKKLVLNLPPREEQKEIVDTLEKWNRAIAVTENLITVKQQQFEWLTTHLLNGKTRLQGHTRKWNKTAFQDIFIPSKSVNKDNADYTVLSVTKNGIVNQSEYFNKDVASEDKSKYLIIERGTLVMSGLNFWMGAIDFQNICDVGVVSPAYKSFKIKKGDFNADYLRFFVRSHYMTRILMMCSVQGASVVRRNLDMDMLMNSVIPLPALSEQKSIAHTLNTAQGEIKLLQDLAEKYRTQKRGLMQKLLSGQWRLSDKKEAA